MSEITLQPLAQPGQPRMNQAKVGAGDPLPSEEGTPSKSVRDFYVKIKAIIWP